MQSESQSLPSTRQSLGSSGEFWALLSSLSYAFTAIFSRIAVLSVHPFVAPIFRLVPVLTISWVQVTRSGRALAQLNPRSKEFIGWRVLFIVLLGGTLTTVVGTVGYFFALQAGGVVLTQPILATNILWGAIIAAIFLKEPLTRKMLVGIVLAVIGVATLGYGSSAGGEITTSVLTAIPLAFIPAIAWAASSNTTRFALNSGLDKFFVIAVGQTWAVLLLAGSLFLTGLGDLFFGLSLNAIGTLLVAGLLTAAAQITLAQALTLANVARVTTINGMNPIIAAILAYFFLNEDLNLLMLAGILITIAGVVYVQMSARQPEAEDVTFG